MIYSCCCHRCRKLYILSYPEVKWGGGGGGGKTIRVERRFVHPLSHFLFFSFLFLGGGLAYYSFKSIHLIPKFDAEYPGFSVINIP